MTCWTWEGGQEGFAEEVAGNLRQGLGRDDVLLLGLLWVLEWKLGYLGIKRTKDSMGFCTF